MSEYKAIVVDDETHCLETLNWQIENSCPNVQVQQVFQNPVEARDYIEENKIDLLFLDIEMPLLNGFDLLRSLNKFNFGLVFTTAYDESVSEILEAHGLDFLLKPIDHAELINAVSMATQNKESLASRLNGLFKAI